jgi:hypothetical protein
MNGLKNLLHHLSWILQKNGLNFNKKNKMNRLEKLKKQCPDFGVNLFDLFNILDTSKSYKYIPLFCKLFKERLSELTIYDEHLKVLDKYGVNRENTSHEKMLVYSYFFDVLGSNRLEAIETFIDNIENKRVTNSDVTSYKSFKDILKVNSLAEIRKIKKTLEKEVRVEFEDEEWIALRPLTFESSLKYGATTTWCTAAKNNKETFVRYWQSGVLVYFINKINGYKFAGFKDVITNDMSFWDVEDTRVDSMNLEINDYMIPELKKIFSSKNSNFYYCDDNIIYKVYDGITGHKMSDEPYVLDDTVQIDDSLIRHDDIDWDNLTVLNPGFVTTTTEFRTALNTLRIIRNEEEN